jgi:cardiolipin synthase
MRNKIGFLILSTLILGIVFIFYYFNLFGFIKSLFYSEKILHLDSPINKEIVNQLRMQLNNSRTWVILGEIFTVFLSSTIIFTGVVIVLENRNPSKTLAWLFVLFFLPLIGFVFYLMFGRNYRKKKLLKEKEIKINQLEKLLEEQMQVVSNENNFLNSFSSEKRLIKLLLKNSHAPFTRNNCAKVLTNGTETFEEIIKEIKNAKNHIHLEYYIIRDDSIGNKIQQLLIEKALVGIEVRLIYDGVGSRKISMNYLSELKKAGVKTKCFLPVVMPFLNSKINYRNHRKIIVIDGKVGFVGGLNIGDEYLSKNKKIGFWRDTHLKLQGDSVYFLQNIFIQDWYFVNKEKLVDRKYFPFVNKCGNCVVQIASSGPDSDWETIQQAYFTTIASAEKQILINSPYLIPDDSILMALKTAALSGVDVRILLPGKPDKKIVYWASHSYFKELLEAGVKIYKFKKGFMHAKILLVDKTIASIGTANMDIRSFQLDFEVNALIYDKNVYERLEKDFFEDIKYSEEVSLDFFIKRPLFRRFIESGARLLSPLL